MIIYLSQISEEGRRFQEEVSSEILELEQEPSIRIHGAIVCDIYAQIVSGRLIVQGKVFISMERECSRCGEFFSTTIEDSSFLRDYVVSPDQMQVDISEDIREAIMLQMTHFPLCSEHCRGVCLHCGVNLNKGDCTCGAQDHGSAWTALDGLELKSKGSSPKRT